MRYIDTMHSLLARAESHYIAKHNLGSDGEKAVQLGWLKVCANNSSVYRITELGRATLVAYEEID